VAKNAEKPVHLCAKKPGKETKGKDGRVEEKKREGTNKAATQRSVKKGGRF